jgi:hypothetical protein
VRAASWWLSSFMGLFWLAAILILATFAIVYVLPALAVLLLVVSSCGDATSAGTVSG